MVARFTARLDGAAVEGPRSIGKLLRWHQPKVRARHHMGDSLGEDASQAYLQHWEKGLNWVSPSLSSVGFSGRGQVGALPSSGWFERGDLPRGH